MKHITILLGVFLLVLCTAPVHALFAGDDVISGVWCPAETGLPLAGSILENDIPNTPPIIPILVEDAKNGSVGVAPDGRIIYFPNDNLEEIIQAGDSFRYRTFDGQDYSNDATVRIRLVQNIYIPPGEFLKFSTPKDTMVSGTIFDFHLLEKNPYWSVPRHGTLTIDYLGEEIGWGITRFNYIPDQGFEGIDRIVYRIGIDTHECGTMFGTPGTIEITVGNPNPIPEFPSAVLPAIFVTGFLGAVLLIRRTREN